MPTAGFNPPQGNQSVAQLQDWIIKLCRDLDYYMNNLDTVNISRLDAKVIIADTITANKLNVSQLSAITADLGTIVAGIIYGAYIATANGTYPRIDFSSAANLLTAFLDANNHLDIIPSLLGVPAIRFTKAGVTRGLLSAGGSLALSGPGIDIDIDSTLNLNLHGGGNVSAQSSAGFIADIVAAINSKAPSFSGFTGSQTVITSVNFGASTTTSKTLNYTNGVLTSIT